MILHIGTNNCLANSAAEVTAGVVTLRDEITQDQPDAHIAISELITRGDKQNTKVKICEINEALKQYCEQNSKVSPHHPHLITILIARPKWVKVAS